MPSTTPTVTKVLVNVATLFVEIMHVNYKVSIEQKQWCARVSRKKQQKENLSMDVCTIKSININMCALLLEAPFIHFCARKKDKNHHHLYFIDGSLGMWTINMNFTTILLFSIFSVPHTHTLSQPNIITSFSDAHPCSVLSRFFLSLLEETIYRPKKKGTEQVCRNHVQ